MTSPDQPRVVDHDAHEERVALDAQIRSFTEQVAAAAATTDRVTHHRQLLELQALQARRKDAFRREVGWQS